MCYSGLANRSGQFVFEYFLCRQHAFRPPYSAPWPSSAGFIRLILLRSLLLNFQCATLATPVAQDSLFLNVGCAFLQLVEELLIE